MPAMQLAPATHIKYWLTNAFKKVHRDVAGDLQERSFKANVLVSSNRRLHYLNTKSILKVTLFPC